MLCHTNRKETGKGWRPVAHSSPSGPPIQTTADATGTLRYSGTSEATWQIWLQLNAGIKVEGLSLFPFPPLTRLETAQPSHLLSRPSACTLKAWVVCLPAATQPHCVPSVSICPASCLVDILSEQDPILPVFPAVIVPSLCVFCRAGWVLAILALV